MTPTSGDRPRPVIVLLARGPPRRRQPGAGADGDIAGNSGSWQWTAGADNDTCPGRVSPRSASATTAPTRSAACPGSAPITGRLVWG